MSITHISWSYIFIIFNMCLSANIAAQVTVINPSFEDTPSDATVPQGWHACADMTTPDIFPGFWGVYTEPSDGDTYVGIITRENSTAESFGQRLSVPLHKETCYEFSVDLAHSEVYAGYNKPIRLQVYLATDKCGEEQLIFTSELIKHTDWKTYPISFKTTAKHKYIILKAFITDGPFRHKGNVLIDNMKPIRVCGQA